MTYDKHRANLHDTLREFERVTGTGNMKNAQFAMAKMVRSLVAMMDAMPTGCGGNCKCGPAPLVVLPVTRPPVSVTPLETPAVVVETDGTTLSDVVVDLPTELPIVNIEEIRERLIAAQYREHESSIELTDEVLDHLSKELIIPNETTLAAMTEPTTPEHSFETVANSLEELNADQPETTEIEATADDFPDENPSDESASPVETPKHRKPKKTS
ncbi:unnamed protein product [Sphagnum tenellum]